MVHDSTGFSLDDINDGQTRLAYVIKTLVDRKNPALFERLDLNDDRIFLEPLLFAYFNSKAPLISLEQILFGYVENDKKPNRVEGYADENGIVHIPEIGYLSTTRPNQKLLISWDNRARACILQIQGERIDYKLQNATHIEDTIEIYRYNHSLLKGYYTDPAGNPLEVEVTQIDHHLENIRKAFRIIQTCWPDYYQEVMAVARTIIVFRNDQVRPFVTMSAHGTAFLSVNEKADEVFFLAEIIHQFGHNILNAVLFEFEEYLRIDPGTSAAIYTLDESDHRTILSAFHGLYTTTKIAECFDIIYDKNIYIGKQQHELIGRLADNADRVMTGLEQTDLSAVFTERGETLYMRMKEICHDVYRRRANLLAHLDTSNQDFVFDYDLFLQRNPITERKEKEDE